MKIVKCRKTTLKTPLTSTATSVKLDALIDSKDVAVVLASFGTWFVLVIKQGSLTEMIKCDGLTQNADGSATATVATSGRGLSPLSPYAGSATGFDFSTGAEVIVTNDPLTMAELAHLNDANTFTGTNTFTETAMPRISASHSYGAGQEEYLATKRYADGVALAGAPDASTTTKGVVEIQTQAEYEAGTTVGGTSAPLVAPASIGARFLSGYAVDAGANDTYVITLSPVPSAYFNGMLLSFKANTANTGACTLNVNALGAKALKQSGSDTTDNTISAGSIVTVQYDSATGFFNILSVSTEVATISTASKIVKSNTNGKIDNSWLDSVLSDGSDGVLNVTSGTTTLNDITKVSGDYAIYNFTTGNISVGATLTTGANLKNKILVLKFSGDTTFAGTIDLSGKGATGGGLGADGTHGAGTYPYSKGKAGSSSVSSGGVASLATDFSVYDIWCGSSGGGGVSKGYAGGIGGDGGGAIIVFCNGILSFTGTLNLNGTSGASGANEATFSFLNADGGSGGGGGGAGSGLFVTKTLGSDTTRYTVTFVGGTAGSGSKPTGGAGGSPPVQAQASGASAGASGITAGSAGASGGTNISPNGSQGQGGTGANGRFTLVKAKPLAMSSFIV